MRALMRPAWPGWPLLLSLALAAPASAEEPAPPSGSFSFGSYGRVAVASDLRGGSGQDGDLVAHGSRLDEGTYAELELRRDDRFGTFETRVVATLALGGPLFHQDGRFDATLALRNLYAELVGALRPGQVLWVGSRMVRGEDVYLLDFWPAWDLNLVGGGVADTLGDFSIEAEAGLARPGDPLHHQTLSVVGLADFGTTEVSILDRPRTVAAARLFYEPELFSGELQARAVLHGELHLLPEGERRRGDGQLELLPSQRGSALSAELTLSGVRQTRFLILSLRHERGLGAFDPLASLDAAFSSTILLDGARHTTLTLSAGLEAGPFGVLLAAYHRRSRGPGPSLLDGNLGAESLVLLRPQVRLGNYLGLAGELGYQSRWSSRLDPHSGELLRAGTVRAGLMPFVSTGARGSGGSAGLFARPQLRLIWTASLPDAGARSLYPEEDPRSHRRVQHFFGLGVEWWFDMSTRSRVGGADR